MIVKRKKKINIEKIRPNYILFPCTLILFCTMIARIFYLCTTDYKVGNTTITSFIKNRNTKEEIILPKRGSILDINGNVLAEDVASYSVIAYLDPKRSENSKEPLHVVDPDATAEVLAPYINIDVETLKNLLKKKAYQVELGTGSRNLSQIQMETIRNLNLPGIDFIASTKRYYPYGDFASYSIGYTVNEEDKEGNIWKTGQLGIEEYYNETLAGRSGYVTYEHDRNGYKIANGREYKENADDGDNIYLTIDSNIQLFTENAMKTMMNDSEGEWGLIIVANAKTGAILSYSTTPSFDPNKKNITNYLDLMTGVSFEPGSTMKIFSYLCAIDSGNYNENDTFDSGEITYTDRNGATTIHDWNKIGWGRITYDYGFALSSNVGAAGLLENKIIDKKTLKNCYYNYGFGKSTEFTFKREVNGRIKFNYDIDAASAAFGQAITITPIQMIEALTTISNNGKLLKPYIVSKIEDPKTNELTYEEATEVIDVVAKPESITKIKELMKSVVCNDKEKCTGNAYYLEDYPIMGKTGTAQIYDETTGTYMKGDSDYLYSFAGLYPTDNPEIIIYTVLKKPKDSTNYMAPAVKNIVINTSKYLNIIDDNNQEKTYDIYTYINKNTNEIKTELEENKLKVFTLGTGEKIIGQYPSEGTKLYPNSVVVLLTDNYDKKIPNLIGLSYKDAINILKLMGVRYTTEGKGYVISQSIEPESIVTEEMTVVLNLE